MSEEIAAGIRNAMERGYSMEEAVNSFIRAGYNPAEVQEASQLITSGAMEIAGPEIPSREIIPEPHEYSQMAPSPQALSAPEVQPSAKKAKKWMFVAIISLLVLIGVGIIGLIFRDQIVASFS